MAETLLMVDLKESEEQLVKRLIPPFEIKAKSVKDISDKDFGTIFDSQNISLVIIDVDQTTNKSTEPIAFIKSMLTEPIPILVLLSVNQLTDLESYIRAGADDYIVMPIDEDSFAMRFYVLLECGQAILQSKSGKISDKANKQEDKKSYEQDKDVWRLIVGFVQEGLRFFTPKYQLARRLERPIFNKWRLVRKIATGSDGAIWLVEEIGKEGVAVAKIPNSSQTNINSLRSAAVLKRLIFHPNIVELIEVVKDEDKFILIQEYVEGVTLWEALSSNPSCKEKEQIALQLISVIAYSHDHKIIHRDIKPDNIMIMADGRLKLLDFGSAKEVGWIDVCGSPEGTLNFMAPEQLDGKASLASDVWALGVILYLFAVHRLPFYQDNSCYPMDIETDMVAILPSKIRADMPIELEKIIMRCLEKIPKNRYQNGSELQEALLKRCPDFGSGIYL
ncbi:MAG: protein kinase [Desulfamplus sp.]|nr:protein kinase [Desulfamplus sp.]